uniref:Uncharacterized protein n=1 Tax=Arundo donax TaxID=35708 RepID=A0A0A9FEZ1_ARUDO
MLMLFGRKISTMIRSTL